MQHCLSLFSAIMSYNSQQLILLNVIFCSLKASLFAVNLQQISQDCSARDQQDLAVGPVRAQNDAYSTHRSMLFTGSQQPSISTAPISVRDRMLFSSHRSLSLVDSTRQAAAVTAGSPPLPLSPAVSVHHPHTHAALQPPFLSTGSVPVTAGSMQPSRPCHFAIPSSSLQSLPTRPPQSTQVPRPSLPREHSSYTIDRLREKIGRGWLPPEPPYPPPPDDVRPSPGISLAQPTPTLSPPEQNRTLASVLPDVGVARTQPGAKLCVEQPLVDSTTEVTTTADGLDDSPQRCVAAVTYLPTRPVEREDGEISDDEPDSVGADLAPDSSGISSSNSRWSQSRPPSFRGTRGGGVPAFQPRPRFPYRSHFPRGRGFYHGRGLSLIHI